MALIYKGKIITVKKQKVKFSDGHTSEYEFVLHQPAVAVVPVIDNHKIMLVRQFRPVIGKKIWEVPAGLINKGETPFQTAKRELTEETGLKADKIIKQGSFYSSPGFTDEKIICFLAREFVQSGQKLDQDEDIETGIFPIRDLLKKIEDQKLLDVKTVLCILMTERYLRSEKFI